MSRQTKTRSRDPVPVAPPPGALRWTLANAAYQLNRSYTTVRELVAEGVLTNLTPKPKRGRNRRVYLSPGEVMAYAAGDAVGAARWRDEQKRRRARR